MSENTLVIDHFSPPSSPDPVCVPETQPEQLVPGSPVSNAPSPSNDDEESEFVPPTEHTEKPAEEEQQKQTLRQKVGDFLGYALGRARNNDSQTTSMIQGVSRRVLDMEVRTGKQLVSIASFLANMSGDNEVLIDATISLSKAVRMLYEKVGEIQTTVEVPGKRKRDENDESDDELFIDKKPCVIKGFELPGVCSPNLEQSGLKLADEDDEERRLCCTYDSLPIDEKWLGSLSVPRALTHGMMSEVAFTMSKRANLAEKTATEDNLFQLDNTRMFKQQSVNFTMSTEKLTRLMHLAELALDARENFRRIEEQRNALLFKRKVHFFNCPEIKAWREELATKIGEQKCEENRLSLDQMDNHIPYYTCFYLRRLTEINHLYVYHLDDHNRCMESIRELLTARD